MMITVPVQLGTRSYDIHVGPQLIHKAGALIAARLPGDSLGRIPVVTDQTVAKLHYQELASSLQQAGLVPRPIVLPPGEATKSFEHLEKLIESLIVENIERSSLIVAFGGGVIGDLAGFAAGILKRGVDFVQIPTTLLAQVDSSVGGKTAINTERGKNLAGVFHQPRLVIADTDVLSTLPRREFLGGYAEVVKYGLLGDADFFTWLEHNGQAVLSGTSEAVVHAVAHSCTMKAAIVTRDEREMGDRALLNLGHTFGHALEAATGYSDRLTHGEGVALGCVLAFKLSARLNLVDRAAVIKVERHFAESGLPVALSDIPGPPPSAGEILTHMRHDKKVQGGQMTFILVRGIGQAFISRGVQENDVAALLAQA
jgi:3-dehydroquinate synthase